MTDLDKLTLLEDDISKCNDVNELFSYNRLVDQFNDLKNMFANIIIYALIYILINA